ncbi:hypothetical protein KP509_16G076600 [Ceratopteris richardii]|uniref:CCT domain-containing protein n=1 Tax=Ceratopteris richardii TaxID=49495 RepID=A0A8T2T4N1_CERRI|nr:hypothetical protein KP509_16G076600 [Ceratopteris richardii]
MHRCQNMVLRNDCTNSCKQPGLGTTSCATAYRRTWFNQSVSRNTSQDMGYQIKRRSSSARSAVAVRPTKRPRTSWGKPRVDLVRLTCLSFFPQEEAAASSTSPCSEHHPTDAVSSSGSSSTRFQYSCVEIQPAQQHLAVKLEDDDDDPLQQIPNFFYSEDFLTLSIRDSPACFDQPSQCMLPSNSWPVSPPSSSTDEPCTEPLCSSVTDEISRDDLINWDLNLQEETCNLLSEQFYEIEKDIGSMMDACAQHALEREHLSQHEGKMSVALRPWEYGSNDCSPTVQPRRQFSKVKEEQAADCGSKVISEREGSPSADVSTVEEHTDLIGEDQEDYRIDLLDFEPTEHDHETAACIQVKDEDNGDDEGWGTAAIHQFNFLTGTDEIGQCWDRHKLTLSLNYEDILNAWYDKGSPFTDGSWSAARVPVLDLTAWQPNVNQADELVEAETTSNMIVIAPPTSNIYGGADISGVSSTLRHARVLRYREKRQTRLFSKKIRYEVRKLNAERRPRMKGRFIKRLGD